MTNVKTREQQAQKEGYKVLSSFTLPKSDWDTFYSSMEDAQKNIEKEYGVTSALEDMAKESSIVRRFGDEFNYLCLLLEKEA